MGADWTGRRLIFVLGLAVVFVATVALIFVDSYFLLVLFRAMQGVGSGMVFATRSVEHPAGSVCATEDRDIHQVSNLMEDGADLVTLHVYSPPLLNMGTYTLFDSTVKSFFDPVHNEVFLDGGGI